MALVQNFQNLLAVIARSRTLQLLSEFRYDCPLCGEEPSRGVFLGARIWHSECVIKDSIEGVQIGRYTEEDVRDRMVRINNQEINSQIENALGWSEVEKEKPEEELEEGIEREKVEEADDEVIGENDDIEKQAIDEGIKAPSKIIEEVSKPSQLQDTSTENEERERDINSYVDGTAVKNYAESAVSQSSVTYKAPVSVLAQLEQTGISSSYSVILDLITSELSQSLEQFRTRGLEKEEYARIYLKMLQLCKDILISK